MRRLLLALLLFATPASAAVDSIARGLAIKALNAALAAGTLTPGSTATSGGAAGQLMFDTGSVLSESGNLVFASNVLTIGLSGTANGKVVLGNVTSGTSFLDAGATLASAATLGTTTLANFQIKIAGTNQLDFNITNSGNWTTPQKIYASQFVASSRISAAIVNNAADSSEVDLNSSQVLLYAGAYVTAFNQSNMAMTSTYQLGWGSSTPSTSVDTMFTRFAAASIHLGAADAAGPVAQTLGVQSVVAGTSNTAGSLWTVNGSQSTGTGVGGDIVFKVAKAGTTGTAQNALTEAFRIAAATALPEWPSSTTGAGTSTFTNSPCSGLTTEQWVPIQITGQTGTWYVPACQ